MPPISRETELLGRIFRMHRELKGKSLQEIARQTGLCINTIRRHESGNMMLRTDDLLQSARALGIDPARLIIRTGDKDYEQRPIPDHLVQRAIPPERARPAKAGPSEG